MYQCMKPLLRSPCHSLIPQGTFSPVVVVLWSVLPPPAPDADLWSLESSVTSLRCSDGSEAACSNPSTAYIIIVANTAFPGKKLAQSCLQVAKQSQLRMPWPLILPTFVILSLVLSPGVFGSVRGPALEEGQAGESDQF